MNTTLIDLTDVLADVVYIQINGLAQKDPRHRVKVKELLVLAINDIS